MKVSIIIPTNNLSYYEVEQRIKKVLKQTYKEKEIIIVDVKSKERLEKLFLKYKKHIKVYTPMPEDSIPKAISDALSLITGEYFVICDEYFTENFAIYSYVDAIKHASKKYNVVSGGLKYKHNKIDKLFYILSEGKNLLISNFMFKKDVLDKYHFSDSNYKYAFYLEFLYKIIFNEEILKSHFCFTNKSRKVLIDKEEKQENEYDVIVSKEIRKLNFKEVCEYYNYNIDKMIKIFKKKRYEKKYLISTELAVHIANYLETKSPTLSNKFINRSVIFTPEDTFFDFSKIKEKDSKKPRLIYHTNAWIVGGIERVLGTLFLELRKKYEIILVATNIDMNVGFALPEGVKYISLDKKAEKNYYSSLTFLCRYLNVDLFVGNQNILENFLKVYELFSYEDIKTIAMNHANYFFPFNYDWLKEYVKERNFYLSYADAVTWPIEFSTKAYNSVNKNALCIYNPIEKQNVVKKEFNMLEPNILVVGRLNDPYKRLDLILRAFKLILKEIPKAKLYAIGLFDEKVGILNKEYISFGELLLKLEIPEENLIFTGPVPNVGEYYKTADLVLFASEGEGFGMVVAEASSYGVPVVSTKLDGIDELIYDGENGFLVEKDNVSEYANKALKILKNKSLKKKMSDKAIKISEKFDKEKIIKEWDKLINNVLKEKKIEFLEVDSMYSNCINAYENYIVHSNFGDKNRSIFKKTYMYFKKNGFILTIKRIFIGITNPIVNRIKRSNN